LGMSFLFDTNVYERDLRVETFCGSKTVCLEKLENTCSLANRTIDNCSSGRDAKVANPFLCANEKGLHLDLSLKARYNKLIDNQEFVEKIATASCLSTPATRDII